MKTTTCLILEASDYTTDGNLRKEAFEALCSTPIVIEGAKVIKREAAIDPVVAPAAPKRPYVKKDDANRTGSATSERRALC